jgi:hypothetical protein
MGEIKVKDERSQTQRVFIENASWTRHFDRSSVKLSQTMARLAKPIKPAGIAIYRLHVDQA